MHAIAEAYRLWARVLEQVRVGFRAVDVGNWEGAAAEGYREKIHALNRRLSRARDDLATAAKAIEEYARTFEDTHRQQALILRSLSTAGGTGLREASPSDRIGRLLAELDRIGRQTARAVRQQARLAPTSSLFGEPDQPSYITSRSPETGAAGSTATGDAPLTQPSPTTLPTATSVTNPPVWTSVLVVDTHGNGTGEAQTPGPPLPPAADNWAPDDPRRKRYVQVQLPYGGHHDALSWIAARELGDPGLWPTLYHLNEGLPQPRGEALHDPNLIKPGWFLALPTDAPPPPLESRVTPFGHDDHSCLPAPGPADDPSVPARTGPSEHTLGPLKDMVIGAAMATGILLAIDRRRKRRRRRAQAKQASTTAFSGDQASSGDRAASNEQTPTIRSIHESLTATGIDPFSTQPPPSMPPKQPPAPSAAHARDPALARHTGAPSVPSPVEWTPLSAAPSEGIARSIDGDSESTGPIAVTPAKQASSAGPGRPDAESTASRRSVAHPGLVRSLGVRDGHSIIVDLAALRGLGFHGAGALGALRALLIDLCLPPTPQRTAPPARVYIPRQDLDALADYPESRQAAGEALDGFTAPRSLRVTPDLDTALSELEVEILRRSRERIDTNTNVGQLWEPIVLVARITDGDTATVSQLGRLESVLALGATLGIAAILLGPWRRGTCCRVDHQGRITATAGPAGIGPALNNTQLNSVPAEAAREILSQLSEPEEANGRPPATARTAANADTSLTEPNHGAPGSAAALSGDDQAAAGQPAPQASLEALSHKLDDGSGDRSTPTPAPTGSSQPEDEHPAKPGQSVTPTTPVPATTPSPTPPPAALLVVLALRQLAIYVRTHAGGPLRDLTPDLTKLQRAMLGCLAAHTEPIPTESLLDMCWPGSAADKDALSKFHSAIYRLRSTLREATDQARTTRLITLRADRYSFNDQLCWIDHHAFLAHLPPTHINTDSDAENVSKVLDHYQGPLLHTLEYDADINWLEPIRAHTRATAVNTAHQLAEYHSDPDQRAECLTRALRYDRANERTARRLIRHYLDHGQSDNAHRVLDQLARDLHELTGLQPEPATIQLLQHPAA